MLGKQRRNHRKGNSPPLFVVRVDLRQLVAVVVCRFDVFV